MITANDARALVEEAELGLPEAWEYWLEDAIAIIDDAIEDCAANGIAALHIYVGLKGNEGTAMSGDVESKLEIWDDHADLSIYNPTEFPQYDEFAPMLDLIGELLEEDGFFIPEQPTSQPSWREKLFGGHDEETSRIKDDEWGINVSMQVEW